MVEVLDDETNINPMTYVNAKKPRDLRIQGAVVNYPEDSIFLNTLPCNSKPFLARICQLLDKHQTNSIWAVDGEDLLRVRACLYFLIGQAWGQLFHLDSLEVYAELAKKLKGIDYDFRRP